MTRTSTPHAGAERPTPDLSELRRHILDHCVRAYWQSADLLKTSDRHRNGPDEYEWSRQFERTNEVAVIAHCDARERLAEAVLLFGPRPKAEYSRPLEMTRQSIGVRHGEHVFIACPIEDLSDEEEGRADSSKDTDARNSDWSPITRVVPSRSITGPRRNSPD